VQKIGGINVKVPRSTKQVGIVPKLGGTSTKIRGSRFIFYFIIIIFVMGKLVILAFSTSIAAAARPCAHAVVSFAVAATASSRRAVHGSHPGGSSTCSASGAATSGCVAFRRRPRMLSVSGRCRYMSITTTPLLRACSNGSLGF
jgi:hypothetical protein